MAPQWLEVPNRPALNGQFIFRLHSYHCRPVRVVSLGNQESVKGVSLGADLTGRGGGGGQVLFLATLALSHVLFIQPVNSFLRGVFHLFLPVLSPHDHSCSLCSSPRVPCTLSSPPKPKHPWGQTARNKGAFAQAHGAGAALRSSQAEVGRPHHIS